MLKVISTPTIAARRENSNY